MSQRDRRAHVAARLSEIERTLRAVSTEETDPRDPRVKREQALREEHDALLAEWKTLA